MNYKVYYVIIAWEWFLCVFSVCFWIGCKWIKKGGLCARALRYFDKLSTGILRMTVNGIVLFS